MRKKVSRKRLIDISTDKTLFYRLLFLILPRVGPRLKAALSRHELQLIAGIITAEVGGFLALAVGNSTNSKPSFI
jgi:hypothetical protein